jgi:hypothetical protein
MIGGADGVGYKVVGIAVGIGSADGVTGGDDLAAVNDFILFNRSAGGSQLPGDQP